MNDPMGFVVGRNYPEHIFDPKTQEGFCGALPDAESKVKPLSIGSVVGFGPGAGHLCGACLVKYEEYAKEVPKYEAVNHPTHYGGEGNPYEAIKVIRAWKLGFSLGNTVKYICRVGTKPGAAYIEDLKKARWYLDEEIRTRENATQQPSG